MVWTPAEGTLFLLVNAIQNIGNKLWTTINSRTKNSDDFIEIYAHGNMVIFARDKTVLLTIISATALYTSFDDTIYHK